MKDRKLCLGGGPLSDGSFLLEGGALLIEDGRILETGFFEDLKRRSDETVDVRGRLILPGLLNPHHHLYSFFAPGLLPKGEMNDFRDTLERLWWPLDEALDEETVYWSALAGLLESLKSGVTAVFDHHASMSRPRGSLRAVRKAFETAGCRGLLCFEISDRHGRKAALVHLEENLDLAAALSTEKAGGRPTEAGTPAAGPVTTRAARVRPADVPALGPTGKSAAEPPFLKAALGLHANFTLSAETLAAVRRAKPEDVPIHIHCGEAACDFEFCRSEGFAGPVVRLDAFGLVNRDSLLIHCVHLSEEDYGLIERSGAAVVANPESNAVNRVGFPAFARFPRLLIGTDGMTGDVVAAWRSAYLLGGERGLAFDRLARAVFDAPGALRDGLFPGTGGFAPGAAADVAVLDYVPLAPISKDNLLGHLLFGAKKGNAWLTMVGGEILFKEGRFLKIDEGEILREAGAAAKKLHARYYG